METQKDQPAVKQESEIKGLGDVWGSEFWEKGMEVFEEPDTKKKEAPKVEAKAVEDECPECPPEEKAKRAREKAEKEGKKPYRTIKKVQGKTYDIYSAEEEEELLSKGADYTIKSQQREEEARKLKSTFDSRFSEIDEIKRQFRDIQEAMQKQKTEKTGPPEEAQPQKADASGLYKQYGLEEEFAEDWQKKLLMDVAEIKRDKESLKEQNKRLSEAYQYMVVDGMLKAVKESVTKAREEYPIEEIVTDEGDNLTKNQFISLLSSKINSPENKSKAIPEMATEVVKEIHAMQQRTRGTVAEHAVMDDDKMTPEDFKAKFPKLFSKLKESIGAQEVATYLSEKDKLPPSLESKTQEIDLKKTKSETKDKNLKELLDEAFEDPEVLEAFSGG